MPRSLAQPATSRSTSNASPLRSSPGPIPPWVWRAAFAGERRSGASVSAPEMQDGVAQAGVVADPERGQHDAIRKRAYQPLAFEHRPYRRIAQPGGIARGDQGIAEVKMVAMRIGQAGDDGTVGLLAGPRMAGKACKLLQQGQGLELQRVEIEGVLLRCHPAQLPACWLTGGRTRR